MTEEKRTFREGVTVVGNGNEDGNEDQIAVTRGYIEDDIEYYRCYLRPGKGREM